MGKRIEKEKLFVPDLVGYDGTSVHGRLVHSVTASGRINPSQKRTGIILSCKLTP